MKFMRKVKPTLMDYGRNEGIFKELKAEPELDRVLKYRPIS
jgi:hypothetical protein